MNTIHHNNGNALFSRCKKQDQKEASQKYTIPQNEPYLYLDTNKRPFIQRPNEPKFLCRVRKESLIDQGFHI